MGRTSTPTPAATPRGRWPVVVLTGVLAMLHVFYAVGDRTWWSEIVAVWPPIGWIAVFTVAIARLRAWPAAALLALLVAIHGEGPGFAGDPDARPELRVVSWNVAGDPRSWEHLRALDADVALLQEHAGPPPAPGAGGHWVAGDESAIVSRWPIRPLPTRRVGPWTDPVLADLTLPDGDHVLIASVRLVLPSLITWVADGLHGSPRAAHEARVGQFAALAQLVDESARRIGAAGIVLCGDFNSPATLPSADPLRVALRDAWTVAGRGWPGTAPAGLPLARIDQCWVSDGLEPVLARARRLPVSDHRLLEVGLRRAAPNALGSAAGPSRTRR